MTKVWIVAVKDMEGMVGRKTAVDGKPKGSMIPFECDFDDLKSFEAALKSRGVVGHQLIFTKVEDTFKCIIRKRVQLRLGIENCGAIRESTFEYIEPDAVPKELQHLVRGE